MKVNPEAEEMGRRLAAGEADERGLRGDERERYIGLHAESRALTIEISVRQVWIDIAEMALRTEEDEGRRKAMLDVREESKRELAAFKRMKAELETRPEKRDCDG